MNLEIFISCHKDYYIPEISFLKGIQVGTYFSDNIFRSMLQDNTGENISNLNRSYCELTGQYWVWKNRRRDVVGFFHYRRYLDFGSHSDRPYRIDTLPDKEKLLNCGYELNYLYNLAQEYDLIIPKGEKLFESVYSQYISSNYHHKRDIDLIIDILIKKYPQMTEYVYEYLNGRIAYWGNIYVMKWPVFNAYMEWLFDLLSTFDKRKNVKGYEKQDLRVNGYIAERLFGIYLTYILSNNKYKVLEVEKIHYEILEGNYLGYLKKKFINFLLPPESISRNFVKKCVRIVLNK